jgi:hypothetical protein
VGSRAFVRLGDSGLPFPEGGMCPSGAQPILLEERTSEAVCPARDVAKLDIGEEDSPYVIDPVEDPVPRQEPAPEREREEEIPA